MSTRKICPHYVKDKKCSYEEYCIEQLLSDEKVCTSKIYYAMSLEQQLDQLKAEVELLRQYKGSKQASYESMQVEWNKAVSQNKDLLKQNEEWQKQVAKLKAENEELEPFKDEYFKGLDNVTIAELAKKSIRITAENCKLEQTLTAIKEIAEREVNSRMLFADKESFCDFNQILQKISEVEDEIL